MKLDVVPLAGEKSTRERLDEIFSRQMLGSVAVGSSFMKIIEKILNWEIMLILMWFIVFTFAVIIFIYWEKVEKAAQTAVEATEREN